MAKGSFNGLYTFDEIAKIYQMNPSNLRKMVQFGKFIEGKEIKKFGKTWIITEEAVRNHFGDKLDAYLRDIKIAELQSIRESKVQNKLIAKKSPKTKKQVNSNFGKFDDDLENASTLDYIEVDPVSVVLSVNFDEN